MVPQKKAVERDPGLDVLVELRRIGEKRFERGGDAGVAGRLRPRQRAGEAPQIGQMRLYYRGEQHRISSRDKASFRQIPDSSRRRAARQPRRFGRATPWPCILIPLSEDCGKIDGASRRRKKVDGR